MRDGDDLLRSDALFSSAPRSVGAVDFAVGTIGLGIALASLPEIAVAGGVLEVLGLIGAITGATVQTGFGIIESFSSIAINPEAKEVAQGFSSPLTTLVVGNRILLNRDLRTVLSNAEFLERLKDISALIDSPSQIEKVQATFNLFIKPQADKLIEDLAASASQSSENQHTADVKNNPVTDLVPPQAGLGPPPDRSDQTGPASQQSGPDVGGSTAGGIVP